MIIDRILGFTKYETATEEEINRFVKIIETNNKRRQLRGSMENMWRSDAVDMYEKIGYMHISGDLYKFEEFKKNVILGEFDEGCADNKYKAHFAFKCNGQWYYVLVLTTAYTDDKKRRFAIENNLNLVVANMHEIATDEFYQHYNRIGQYAKLSEEAEALICNKEVRKNRDIHFEHQKKVQSQTKVISMDSFNVNK